MREGSNVKVGTGMEKEPYLGEAENTRRVSGFRNVFISKRSDNIDLFHSSIPILQVRFS